MTNDPLSLHISEPSDHAGLSRRKWLGFAASASLVSGLSSAAAAKTTRNSSGKEHDRGTRTYNIRDFGAKGDGSTLDTAAMQAAIDACSRDQGGTVLVPAGVFVIGTVELKSNVTLHLASASTLLGSADGKQYHSVDEIPLRGDSTLNDGNVGLIFAVNAENVAIEGSGTIDGQGAQFRSPTRGVPPPSGRGGAQRPYHLLFYKCKNLSVQDIFLTQSAFHSIRIIQSSYVKLNGLRIYNRVNHNNDGFHFISSEHVYVSNCDVQCQDDACALFGSCKFVTVTNCLFSTRWSVFRFGGGIAENITVSNCLIYQTFGCPIKMRCSPGSRFENISFSNLVMDSVTGPISIGVGPRQRRNKTTEQQAETDEAPGIVRNISFNGIHATVVVPFQFPDVPFTSGYNPGEIKSCIGLNAVDGDIEKISLNDVHISFPGGGTPEEAAVREVPKIVGEYYAAGVFPAYGLYARGIHGLTLNNVRFEVAGAEARPAIVFDHVIDAAINGLSVQGTAEAESVLRFIDTQDVLVTASRVLAKAPVYLQVEGSESREITIDGGDLSKAATALSLKTGVRADAVKLRQ
jgi:polygalacturonase